MSKHVVKAKTYIVLRSGTFGQPHTIARYRVGAKNKKNALKILHAEIGKHVQLRVYYEVTDPKLLLLCGEIVREV